MKKAFICSSAVFVSITYVLAPSATAGDVMCFGRSATVTGTQGDDVLRGTLGSDVIVGRGGNDAIVARAGNDFVCAGSGADRIEVGPGADRVAAGNGRDMVLGGLGSDRLAGGDGDDRLGGGAGGDQLAGDGGWDALDGGTGANRNRGGSGADHCINPDSGGGALGCETLLVFSTTDRQFDAGVPNQGAWSNQSAAIDSSSTYIATRDRNGRGERNFFTFHLDSLAGNIVAVRLVVQREAGCERPTYGLFDVTTNAESLNNNVGRNAEIFSDLGSGTSYGTFQPRPLTCHEGGGRGAYRLDLNAAAMSDVSLAAGGVFSLGGAIRRPTTGMLFGDSGDPTRLVVGITP